MRTPKFILVETDSGVDGLDSKSKTVARFDTKELAEKWLTNRGYTHRKYHHYEHVEPARRHCMGQIYYSIHEDPQVPENPE